jgi:hypothetical protein
MTAPLFSKNTISSAPTSPPRRFNPWRMFVGSMIPNWLQCRPEIGQGPKLAYGRLAQYAGEDGKCFPKQATLAAELGVSERMVNEYIRTLVRFGLIEKERPGLGRPNHYFFLNHPWIYERQPEITLRSNQQQQKATGSMQNKSSGQETQQTSVPYNKEIQIKESPEKRLFPHSPPKGDCENNVIFCNLSNEEQIYAAYPKKVGKPAALRAIRRALIKHSFEFLLERTQLFARICNSPADFIPHPSTWFNQQRFNDDPATWRRSDTQSKPKPTIIRADKFGCDVSKL